MLPVGFEPTISAGEQPQTPALDRPTTGTNNVIFKNHNLLTNSITSLMEQDLSWEPNSSSSSLKISPYLRQSKRFHYRLHNSQIPVPTLSQINSVHALSHHFLKDYFNIILTSTPFLSNAHFLSSFPTPPPKQTLHHNFLHLQITAFVTTSSPNIGYVLITILNKLVTVTGWEVNWIVYINRGDRGSTVVKVLCYKLVGRWLDPSWCQWILYWHKILPIALWPWGRPSL